MKIVDNQIRIENYVDGTVTCIDVDGNGKIFKGRIDSTFIFSYYYLNLDKKIPPTILSNKETIGRLVAAFIDVVEKINDGNKNNQI